jgi:hypothetical protein
MLYLVIDPSADDGALLDLLLDVLRPLGDDAPADEGPSDTEDAKRERQRRLRARGARRGRARSRGRG